LNLKREAILNRLVWLTVGRPLMATPLLTLILFNFHAIESAPDVRLFYVLIVLRGCLTLCCFVVFQGIKNIESFTALQLVLDLFLESLLIGVTGHVESPFSILYIVTIVSSAYFFHEKGGVLIATAALLLLGRVVFLKEVQSSILTSPVLIQTPYRLFLHAIAFYAVGITSGRFFSRTDAERIDLYKLRVLHDDIIKSIPSGVVTTDSEGRITSFNRAAFLITGILPLEAIGRIWWDIFSWGEIKNQYQTLISSGVSQCRFEGEVFKKNGGHCFLGATISPLRNDQGELIGVIGIFQDLTKFKIMEEEMYQKRRLAIVGEMAAGMAHEIRNPLAALSGAIQLLKNEPCLQEENRCLMEIALQETDRLNTIITSFLLYAKPNPPCRRWITLGDLLEESVALMQKSKLTESTQVILKMGDPSSELFVDPDQLKQVFWNLAVNAFAAMPKGGVLSMTTKQIFSTSERGQEVIAFYFHDTGSGISKDDLHKIFYPFFTTKSSGSGLGLAIVQRIIAQHDGIIDVESAATGTTFRIEIPIHPKGVDFSK